VDGVLSPELAKEYEIVHYDPRKGYPGRWGRYYRCPICGEIIPASPLASMACTCGNLLIETGTMRVKNHEYEPQFLKKRSIFQRLANKR